MTDWPRYDVGDDTYEREIAHEPRATERRKPREEPVRTHVPVWVGSLLALCFLLVAGAIAVAALSLMQLSDTRSDLKQMRSQMAALQNELGTTRLQLTTDETKLHLVENAVTQVVGKQSQLTNSMQEVRDQWDAQRSFPNLNWLEQLPPDPTQH